MTTELPVINQAEDGYYVFVLARYGPTDQKRHLIRLTPDGMIVRKSTDQNDIFAELDQEDERVHFERCGGGRISINLNGTVIYYSCERIDMPAANQNLVEAALRTAFPKAVHIGPL